MPQRCQTTMLSEQRRPTRRLSAHKHTQLYAPMAVALWCAIVVEAGIGHWTDMGILLGIQLVNAGIGWHESTKAADAVAALKSSLKPMATAKRDGVWVTVGADGLVPGDLVKLVAGAAVPADCRLRVGTCQVDASALTGESLPVTAGPGCDAQMGATCVRGEAVAVVTATGAQTFFGRTAALLNTGAGGVDNITKVLMRLTLALSVLAAVLCTVVLAYLLAKRRENVRDVLSFVIVLLVASIPIAIQIVSTTTLAMGAGELATHGAIVARLAAVEELAGMNVLCSDKTGTLTMNKMALQADSPVYEAGADAAAVLKLAALAARWREPPADALDTMTLGALDLTTLDGYEQPRYEPFDAAVKRTSAIVRAPDGTHFGVAKGAAAALAALLPPGPETDAAVARMNTDVDAYARRGVRCMVVARTADTTSEAAVEGAPWHLAGLLTFLDPPRPDTKGLWGRGGCRVRPTRGERIAKRDRGKPWPGRCSLRRPLQTPHSIRHAGPGHDDGSRRQDDHRGLGRHCPGHGAQPGAGRQCDRRRRRQVAAASGGTAHSHRPGCHAGPHRAPSRWLCPCLPRTQVCDRGSPAPGRPVRGHDW